MGPNGRGWPRHFPHKATIELVERVPYRHLCANDGQFRIVDVEGKVVGDRAEPADRVHADQYRRGCAEVEPGALPDRGDPMQPNSWKH